MSDVQYLYDDNGNVIGTKLGEQNSKPEKPKWSSEQFYKNANEIALDAEKILRVQYPGKNVKVKIDTQHGMHRDLEKQWDLYKSGKSKSSIGMHNFGAAADYNIYIDGQYMDGTTYAKQKPYRALGTAAEKHGYFWGWDWDSRHVGATRFVSDFFQKYPEVAHQPNVKAWYFKNEKETKASYRKLMTYLDSVYSTDYYWEPNKNRKYTGDEMTIDPLLEPMDTTNIEKIYGYIKDK